MASEHIAFCAIGHKEVADWSLLKGYFEMRGYEVTIYQGADDIQGQIKNADMINKGTASLLIAMDMNQGKEESVFLAVAAFKKGEGRFLQIDEVQARHSDDSYALAELMAKAFKTKVIKLPLFPLLGIDMPGIFLRITYQKDSQEAFFARLEGCIKEYFKSRRGEKDAY